MKILNKIAAASVTFAVTSSVLITTVAAQSYDSTYYRSTDSAANAGLGIGVLAFYCCICLISLLVPTAIAYFVYKDAVRNEVDNPILWAILTFFLTVVGLLIYFLAIRPDAIKQKESRMSGGSTTTPPAVMA